MTSSAMSCRRGGRMGMITTERFNQLANDPMMCNITSEVQECLQELIALRAEVDVPAEMCENCDDNEHAFDDAHDRRRCAAMLAHAGRLAVRNQSR